MNKTTVAYTAETGLCCGCGICIGICPKGCISWEQEHGLYLPVIDKSACIGCGLCATVCPGLGHTYAPAESAAVTVSGSAIACFNAWSNDSELRHVSASGGVISTLIRSLVLSGIYDGAFCLDSYDYHNQLRTRLYTAAEISDCWNRSNSPKSRYLPVSHENALRHIKAHRNSKLIFVGTSCAIRGLRTAIQKLGLPWEQYLFVGLFCDKVFNYNVLSYFENTYASGKSLKALHFKNKESGGWPGDMKFFPEEGVPFYVPLNDRAKAKAYFMPERCLYCVDKLNAQADISLGDNYTGKDESELGSNSVIVRTQAGMDAWNRVQDQLEIRPITLTDIQNAQVISRRLNNLYYGDLKHAKTDLNPGIPREKNASEFVKQREAALQRLHAGAVYHKDPSVLERQLRKDNAKPNPIIHFIRRAANFIKRNLTR